jgi:PIN domain nuclease of toxin-antitoxin system
MRLLLDTHVWLWSLLTPDRLPQKVSRLLADPRTELWLSSISVWELLALARRGRIRLGQDPNAWLDAAFERAPLHEAPVSHEIARATSGVGLAHGDPADRLIAATARALDLTLLTADERLLAGTGYATRACR